MSNLSNDQKAKLYNQMLFQYQRLQEQIRLIRAESFEPSAEDIRKINQLEAQMKRIYNDTQRLYS
jgi:hypothetical protein